MLTNKWITQGYHFFFFTFLFLVVTNLPHLINHVPVGDDIALIANSTPLGNTPWTEWFTSGFAEYFNTYPEWKIEHTNFIRPLFNIVYFLNYAAFGKHYGLYLLISYFFHALGVMILYRNAYFQSTFSDPKTRSLLLLLFLVNPAVTTCYLITPCCAYDLLGGVLLMGSLIQFQRKRHGSALLLQIVALLAKESAILVTGCCILYALLNRQWRVCILYLLPVVFVGLSKGVIQSSDAIGLYPFLMFANLSVLFKQLFVAIQVWPTGLLEKIEVINFFSIILNDKNLTQINPLVAFKLVLNLSAWGYLLLLVVKLKPIGLYLRFKQDPLLLMWAIWLGGLIGLSVDTRFGYLYYLLTMILLAKYSTSNLTAVFNKKSVLVTLLVLQAYQYVVMTSKVSIYPLTASFFAQLKEADKLGKPILVLHALPISTAPKWVATISGLSNELVFINQITRCAHPAKNNLTISHQGSDLLIDTKIPECASLEFSEVNIKDWINLDSKEIKRGSIQYKLPNYDASAVGNQLRLGDELLVRIHEFDHTVVVYDFETMQYRLIH